MRITLSLIALILASSPAFAGTTYSDVATWSALTTTVSTEDFEAYGVSDTPSGSYTGFSATALTGAGFEYIDFAGDMSLCDGDGGVAPEIEFTLDVSSTLFGLVPQSLDFSHEVCGYYGGSLVECIAVTSDATFTGFEFVSLVDTVVFDATVIDSICVGTVYTEADNDGDSYTTTAEDCNDSDPLAYPGVSEIAYDGSDNDCDSSTPDDDLDGDGYDNSSDCDDNDAAVYLDQTWCEDADLDGYSSSNCVTQCHAPGSTWSASNPTTDCDDGDAAISPSGTETCNGYDDNCDETVDEADATGCLTYYEDVDGDSYGSSSSVCLCAAEGSYTAVYDGDCNDADVAYNPGASESCSEDVDYNCDGSTGYANADADGYAACEECNDSDPAVYPGATEACNGYDDDCDDSVDEAGAVGETTWCHDEDADGYTNPETCVTQCDAPAAGWFNDRPATDCNDRTDVIHPGAEDVPDNSVDEDCDGEDATVGDDDTGDDDSGDDDSGDDDSGDDDSAETGDDDSGEDPIVVDEITLVGGGGCIGCQSSLAPTWERGVGWLVLMVVIGLATRRKS